MAPITAKPVNENERNPAAVAIAVESALPLAEYLAYVVRNDPDIQLAQAKVREARARQQNVVKKRFLNLFNFINAENLLGSAENDVKAAEARAMADQQTALLEAGLMALDLASAQLDTWATIDELVLNQRQYTAMQYQFNAGKLNRYQLDASHADWVKVQQAFRTASQLVTDKQLKLSANIMTANQLKRPLHNPLQMPDLYDPDQPLQWLPVTQEPVNDCSTALASAINHRPELFEFTFKQQALAKLIKLSKLSQRPVLLTNQQQLLLKKQKFERTLAIEVESTCTAKDAASHTLPQMAQAAQRAHNNVQAASKDLAIGRISQLEWQAYHQAWVQAHVAWRKAAIQLGQLNWRLRYLTGELAQADLHDNTLKAQPSAQ
jgi:hypothetical protein